VAVAHRGSGHQPSLNRPSAVTCHRGIGCSLSSQLPLPAVTITAAPLATPMYSEACAFLVQAAGYACAHVLQNEEVEKRDSCAGRHAVPRVRCTMQEVWGMLGGRRWSSSGGEGTQQSNIKPTSTARNVVVTTARAMMKAAKATVAGATRTTATMVTTSATAATMMPNGDKHNNQILSRHQR